MLIARFVIAFLFCASVALSQEIPPPEPQRAPAAQDNPGTERQPLAKTPIVVNVVHPPRDEVELANKARERDEKSALDRQLVSVTTNIANFTLWLVVATVILGIATAVLGVVAWRQLVHFKRAERAYIELSHKSPPGFLIRQPVVNGKNVAEIKIKMKNFGKTPGRIVECFFTTRYVAHGDTLRSPTKGPPLYNAKDTFIINATLMPRGNVIFETKQFEFEADMPNVQAGKLDLWLIGYADFVDAFGSWHRSGYARQFAPGVMLDQNNLVFGRERGHNNEWGIKKRKD